MRIGIASDHAGLDYKKRIITFLEEKAIEVIDLGPYDTTPVDYPDYAKEVAVNVAAGALEGGILICGTGIGMSIAANKVKGARAAVVNSEWAADLTKKHNNANIICLAARNSSIINDKIDPFPIIEAWLNADYEGGRHQNRLDKIGKLENE